MAGNTTYKEAETRGEPSLDDLLSEPIIQLFMKRDGVKASDMRGEFHRIQRDWPGMATA